MNADPAGRRAENRRPAGGVGGAKRSRGRGRPGGAGAWSLLQGRTARQGMNATVPGMWRRGLVHRLALVLCLVAQVVIGIAPAGTILSLRMPCACGEENALPCCAACIPEPALAGRSGSSPDASAASSDRPEPLAAAEQSGCSCCQSASCAPFAAAPEETGLQALQARLSSEAPPALQRAADDDASCSIDCLPGCLCCLELQTPRLPVMSASTEREIDPLLPCASVTAESLALSLGRGIDLVDGDRGGGGFQGDWSMGALRALAARPLAHVRLLV